MKNRLLILFGYLVFLLLFYFERELLFMESEITPKAIYSVVVACMLLLASVSILMMTSYINWTRLSKRFILIQVIFFIYTLFGYPLDAQSDYFVSAIPILGYIYSYYMASTPVCKKHYDRAYIIFYLLLTLYFIFFYNYLGLSNFLLTTTISNYGILFALPLVLCSQKNYIKYFAIIIAFVSMFVTFKRTGIASLVLALIVYFYVCISTGYLTVLNARFKVLINIIFISLIIGSLYVVYQTFDDNSFDFLLQRFADLSADEGSGRIDIYKNVWDMFEKSDLVSIIFGHGFRAVQFESSFKLPAHNDYLEILYDMGIFCFALFISWLISLLKYCLYLIKLKSQYAAPLAFTIVVFLINSSFSHIVIYPKFLLLFALTWGYIIASSRYELLNKLIK